MAPLFPSLLARYSQICSRFSRMSFEVTQSCFTRCVVGIFYEFAPIVVWDELGRGARA